MFVPDPDIASIDWGPVRGVDIAVNDSPDPTQLVRLTVWERGPIYLTRGEVERMVIALRRALG